MLKSHEKFHSSNGKRLVLVAEDEEINRDLLGSVLKEDYEVLFAADGLEALQLIQEHQHMLSIVLLDLIMPKMGGLELLEKLKDDHFRIAVLRPPMIYGPGCRGNYPRLAGLARKLPVFPQVQNQRSMLYIGTLCEFVMRLIESGKGGLYFPQNREYVNTTEMVQAIAECHGKKITVIPGFGWLIRLAAGCVGVVGKVFGTLTYDKSMSQEFADDGLISFEESIRRTEAE